MAYGLWRALVVLHRYVGVAVGLLMAVWFVSGIVMMYVGFPRLTEAERLRALSPVSWQACCRFGPAVAHPRFAGADHRRQLLRHGGDIWAKAEEL